jgi:glucokinase
MPFAPDTLTLVADIGGTNTRVALAQGRTVLTETIRRYANAENAGLAPVLGRYVGEMGGVNPAAACVAVAGPVKDGRGTLTNLDWSIDGAALTEATGAEVTAILNDLQAQGHALGYVDLANTRVVVPFPAVPDGAARLVVNVGNGVQHRPGLRPGGHRLVPPAEAGHVTLPVRNEVDLRMAQLLAPSTASPR